MPHRQTGKSSALALGIAITLALATNVQIGLAAEVVVDFTNLRNASGNLLVAICPEETFTERVCAHVGAASAAEGRVVVDNVPPGTYAVQAIHDENGNNEFDRSRIGWPLEGVAFSRDARIRFGPPAFSDASVEISPSGNTLTLIMRYFD